MRVPKPFFLLLALLCGGCATGLKQGPNPAGFHAAAPGQRHAHRTVVLFLVDGLAVRTLRTGLRAGRTPNIARFFLRGREHFALGEAAFPTETYPNISSILTTRAVGDQPVIANHVLAPSGKILAYEDAQFFPLLRSTIDPISVIGALNEGGRETATFSYVFGLNATDHMRVGLKEGIEYEEHHFRSLDGRLLDNLERFLRARGGPDGWPDFLYVHLVGIDGNSHRYGPDSPQVQTHLAWLDQRIGSTLRLLERGEKHGEVVSILTADHGFVSTTRYVPLAKLVRKARLDTVILNEGRFLALHLPSGHPPSELAPVLEKARSRPGVELTALRRGQTLEIGKGRRVVRFAIGPSVCEESSISLAILPDQASVLPASAYRCPTDFDDIRSAYPFLVDGVSRYLTAPNHPDAIVVATPHVSFTKGMLGNHGGPTAEESFVPVLLRNASLQGDAPVRTSDLLKLVTTPAL